MKTVTFSEGDFIIVPDGLAKTFTDNDPSAEAVYDWETGRRIWRKHDVKTYTADSDPA